jgi:hypothetical protein
MRGVGFQQCQVPCHFPLRGGETTFEHDPGDGGLNASDALCPSMGSDIYLQHF